MKDVMKVCPRTQHAVVAGGTSMTRVSRPCRARHEAGFLAEPGSWRDCECQPGAGHGAGQDLPDHENRASSLEKRGEGFSQGSRGCEGEVGGESCNPTVPSSFPLSVPGYRVSPAPDGHKMAFGFKRTTEPCLCLRQRGAKGLCSDLVTAAFCRERRGPVTGHLWRGMLGRLGLRARSVPH